METITKQIQDAQITEVLNKDVVDAILETSNAENKDVFNITEFKDFTKIFEYISLNKYVSNEMKSIAYELQTQLNKKTINIKTMEDLMVRLVRYYKLNTSVLALHYYNAKVKSDVENISRVLKAFVITNRNLISEHTKHIILEKKPINGEFNTIISAENLKIFDIFEKVSLNNLKEVLFQSETIFTDIYIAWVLTVILAVSLDKTDYTVQENENVKKTHVLVLKEKIALLNTDSGNPIIKSLVNVVKKEKVAPTTKTKKNKEEISNEDVEVMKKINNLKKFKKPTLKKQQISVNLANFQNEVKSDLTDIYDEEIVNDNDIEME